MVAKHVPRYLMPKKNLLNKTINILTETAKISCCKSIFRGDLVLNSYILDHISFSFAVQLI